MDYQPGAKSQQHCNKIEVSFLGELGSHTVLGLAAMTKKNATLVFWWMDGGSFEKHPSAPTPSDCRARLLQGSKSFLPTSNSTNKISTAKCVLVGCGPLPVTVTTRISPFLVGNPYKPSFVTVTGWGVDRMYWKQTDRLPSQKRNRQNHQVDELPNESP